MDTKLYFCIHSAPLNGSAVLNRNDRICPEQTIAAVVVTYNRKELLVQCIEHILNQQDISCDVLVADNASTDGTAQRVQSIPNPRVRCRNTGANLGGAADAQLSGRHGRIVSAGKCRQEIAGIAGFDSNLLKNEGKEYACKSGSWC